MKYQMFQLTQVRIHQSTMWRIHKKLKTTFVDEKGNPIPGVDAITEEGDSDTPLTKEAEVKAKIKELETKVMN